MSKTLSNILTVFKVARILAKVVFILCIVGAVGCIVGLITLPMLGNFLPMELFAEKELNLPSVYLACSIGAITCIGEVLFAYWAERYFKNVLSAGTPFTFEGARESFRLGIASIIISVAIPILSELVSFVILLFSSSTLTESELSISASLSTGLFFLFLSLIFKHGAELRKATSEEAKQETESSEIESH